MKTDPMRMKWKFVASQSVVSAGLLYFKCSECIAVRIFLFSFFKNIFLLSEFLLVFLALGVAAGR